MKKILFFLILLVAFSGCEKKGVKVVNVSNSDYLTVKQVDKPPVIRKESLDSAWTKKLLDILSVYNKDKNMRNKEFDSRIFIDKNGMLSKIIIIDAINKTTDNKIIKMIESWKIEPALRENSPVNFKGKFALNIRGEHTDLIFEKNHTAFKTNKSVYFVAVEQMPSPIGGLKAIQKKIVYPGSAKDEGIEGRVYIHAFINEKGTVDRAKVLKGIGGGCDQAALKAVEETKFTPGRQRGKTVKTQVSIPIIFKLK